MANLSPIRKKLIKALNTRGYNLTFEVREFKGYDGMIHNLNTVYQTFYNPKTHKNEAKKLYSTASQLRMVYYLRDMWFLENDQELPEDQELWTSIRKKLIAEGNLGYGKSRV